MRLSVLLAIAVLIGGSSSTFAQKSTGDATADYALNQTGIAGGFVVHVNAGGGKTALSMYSGPAFRVHALDRDAKNVEKARALFVSKQVNGHVTASKLTGKQLPFITNMVNLLIAEGETGIAEDEIRRVLVPNGVALIKSDGNWKKIVKPRSNKIDDWTHYLHDSTGNAVAKDDLVGPPRHLQWLGTPRWSRHHDRMASMSALVSAGGRMFYIMDEGSRVSIQLPPKWTLIARDAFNGTILWKRKIGEWHSHLWPLKSGPTQLARRLVASDDKVFVTLGINAPVSILDAKTGKTLSTVAGSKGTEEIVHANGKLLLSVNPGKWELSDYKPIFNVGDQRRVRTEFLWKKNPRHVIGVDTKTGKQLWKHTSPVAPLSMCSNGKFVCYHNGAQILVRDTKTGKEVWKSKAVTARKDVQFNFGLRLVIYKDTLLYAGGDRKMAAFDLATGKPLWDAPHDKSGYESPEDLLVAGGLLWSAPTTRTRDTGILTGRDPRTGKIKKKFAPNVSTYWFHHRCYIAKATDKFLMPSRTGIEFVDFNKQKWEIHHWVRGGCLYGVMPCNGLLYAPPHNCACYPEAKLFGFNALAPVAPSRAIPKKISDKGRLEKGPAFGSAFKLTSKTKPGDWPTYRGNLRRSGHNKQAVPANLASKWETKLGGKLTSPVIANGTVYVVKIDEHTVYAIDEETGKQKWTFTAGGRVDSPPTINLGMVVFGSADGWIYNVRDDGKLIWRFRAAPIDRRLMSFEQLESAWPVHGSVLVQDNKVYAMAGRSNFLDGGIRFIKLDIFTGQKEVEKVIDDKLPGKGTNIQARIQTLQMPAGLPDILSTDGQTIYMRSQEFDQYGKRLSIGPHSGNAAVQGSTQKGPGRHIFAPMGFLDDTWFHRSYWVYGRSFAGGHNGYYQAGKATQSGRILVHNDDSVYGFARKPNYYKWTTPLEHQLFGAGLKAPEVKINPKLKRRGRRGSMVRFTKSKSLDPTDKELIVEAWVKAAAKDGVVLARGGPAVGYALILKDGRPRFVIRRENNTYSATAKDGIVGKWTHLVGTLTKDKKLRLYVNGELAKTSDVPGVLNKDPLQSLEIGADDGGGVGQYRSPFALRGIIDEVKIYHGTMTAADVKARFKDPKTKPPKTADVVLAVSFDKGKAQDASGKKNHGTIENAMAVAGKVGQAMRFRGGRRGGGNRGGGSAVKHKWKQDVPIFIRGMVLAGDTLFITGPPDLMDEEKTFEQLKAGDKKVQVLLKQQEAALNGAQGGIVWAISTKDGKKLGEVKIPSPVSWDGLAAANKRLFITTIDGRVICLGAK